MEFLLLLPSPITVILSIFIFSLSLFCLWKKTTTTTNKKVPPEPVGRWPLIGHLPLLRGHIPGRLGALADKHGPIFTIRLGVQRALVVSNPEIARECLSGLNDRAFSNRPKSIALEHISYNYAQYGFGPYGPYWREMRKIMVHELLSNHRLAMLSHVRELEVRNLVKQVHDKWVREDRRCLVEMKKLFEDLFLKVIAGLVAGNIGKTDSVDKIRKAFKPVYDLTVSFTMADAIPSLRWFDLGGYEKDVKRTVQKMDELLQEWLNEHKRRKNSGKVIIEAEKDFMDVLLETLDGGANKILNFDVDSITKATCVSIVLGTITTSVTLIWAVALLLNNPRVLKKAQEELKAQVGGQRLVKESDIKNLVYLQAIIKETLRLYPPTVLGPPRVNTEDCTVGGYRIPSGTLLFVNLWKIHHDPQVWLNPWEFQPERFLTTDHEDVDYLRGMQYEFLPFGSGRRQCPGISLTVQILPFTLASLLQAFEIATPSNEPVDMTESAGFTSAKEMPLQVLLTPRLPYGVYG